MDWSLPQTLNDIKQVSYLSIFLRSFLFSCGHVVNLNGWQTISSLLHHLQAGVLGKKTEISTQCPCYLANSDARLHHSQFTLPLLHTQAIIIVPCYYLCKMNFGDIALRSFHTMAMFFNFAIMTSPRQEFLLNGWSKGYKFPGSEYIFKKILLYPWMIEAILTPSMVSPVIKLLLTLCLCR